MNLEMLNKKENCKKKKTIYVKYSIINTSTRYSTSLKQHRKK